MFNDSKSLENTIILSEKYKNIEVKSPEPNAPNQKLETFLCNLLMHLAKNKEKLTKENLSKCTFGSKELESKKIHAFLYANNLLKTAKLHNKYKIYGNKKELFTTDLKTIISSSQYKKYEAFINLKLTGLRGYLRESAKDLKVSFKGFDQLHQKKFQQYFLISKEWALTKCLS